jgi:hypothetical protein
VGMSSLVDQLQEERDSLRKQLTDCQDRLRGGASYD